MKCPDPHGLGPALPPPPDIDTDCVTVRAFHALGRVFHLHRQAMTRRLSNPGTHHGELFCLRLLARSDGMSQRDLADTLHLSRPRVTSILQGLEKAGAVRREPDSQDQRITRVFLTAEGRRREMMNRAALEEYVERTLGRMSEADQLELIRLLDQVSGNIAELLCPDSHEPEVRVS
jgi:MarR family transcriptional regulator, organic hydroperoxide resistance regulator